MWVEYEFLPLTYKVLTTVHSNLRVASRLRNFLSVELRNTSSSSVVTLARPSIAPLSKAQIAFFRTQA